MNIKFSITSFFLLMTICLFPHSAFSQNVKTGEVYNHALDSLQNILKTAKEDTNKVNLLIQMSEECDETKLLKYAEPAFHLAEKLNYKKGIAIACNNIGFVYDLHGEVSKALEYYYKSLKIEEEIADKEGIAYSLINIGHVYEVQGDTRNALDCNKKSLKIFEEIKNKEGIASALNNIGAFYDEIGNYPNALDCYNKN